LKNGSILVGGTGSGKSLTALSYYKATNPGYLYIVTTAKKRDEKDWEREAAKLGITDLVVDSWNNIKKYVDVSNSFFIFDEQRVVGYGVWTKSFIRITRSNKWILLSATPADTWMDLLPVFIANGFYKNKTHFIREHVDYAPYIKYPKITGYRNVPKLERNKSRIFVNMPFERHTTQHIETVKVKYEADLVKQVVKTQWSPFTEAPIDSMAAEVSVVRQIVNRHPSRIFELMKIQERVKRLIIFYNFNFELDILKLWFESLTVVAEHNGHQHQPVPTTDEWVYLVQYASGSEAWECFTTNHMAFYSMSYSYRTTLQAMGRIDRHNTHYKDLYYYRLMSASFLDFRIFEAFKQKKNFNINMLYDPRIPQMLL
jgi:hypothetical protein